MLIFFSALFKARVFHHPTTRPKPGTGRTDARLAAIPPADQKVLGKIAAVTLAPSHAGRNADNGHLRNG
jgi:hypothetical protein